MFSFSGPNATTFYEMQSKDISCGNGFRCISHAPGAGCPVWGTDISDIFHYGTNSGGAIYLVPSPAIGQPQIGIRNVYIRADSMASSEYGVSIGSCDTLSIDLIEINNALNGSGILNTSSGVYGVVGTIKSEVSTNTVASSKFINATDSHLKIGALTLLAMTINSSGNVIYGIAGGGARTDIYVDNVLLTFAATPVGTFYLAGGSGGIPFSYTFGNITGLLGQSNAWLTWIPSSATAVTTRVMTWENGTITQQGDANATLAIGTNNQILAFTTNLTAGRTVQLTDAYAGGDTNLYTGFKWKIVNAQPTYANSVTVTNAAGGTVATLASNGYVELAYYRFGWLVTGYGTWTGTTP